MDGQEAQSDIFERIGAIEHRQAIADLIHGYARNIRLGNDQDCVPLFTEDAAFEVRDAKPGALAESRSRSRVEGRAAIGAYLQRGTNSGASVCPMISNLMIELDGAKATSTCTMTSMVWPGGQRFVGQYEDSFRNEGGWRFTGRVFTMLGEFGFNDGPKPSASSE